MDKSMVEKHDCRIHESQKDEGKYSTDDVNLMAESVFFANLLNDKLKSMTVENAKKFLENFEKHVQPLTITKESKDLSSHSDRVFENYTQDTYQEEFSLDNTKALRSPGWKKEIIHLDKNSSLLNEGTNEQQQPNYGSAASAAVFNNRQNPIKPEYRFDSPRQNPKLNTFNKETTPNYSRNQNFSNSSYSESNANHREVDGLKGDQGDTLFQQGHLIGNKINENEHLNSPAFKADLSPYDAVKNISNTLLPQKIDSNSNNFVNKYSNHRNSAEDATYEKPLRLPYSQEMQQQNSINASTPVSLNATQTQVSNVTEQNWMQTRANNKMQCFDLNNKKSINILVLGQTGVGKSTWINAFANYLMYNTLQEAISAGAPVCVIPTKFSMFDDNYQAHDILLGSHNNETFSDEGQSSTQDAKTYFFEKDDYNIYIIDTPGMDDTRGSEQDNKNIQKILRAVAPFSELHAICFLFKANEARLTQSFKYCISKLLSNLSKNALNNACFVFTNARGTFYKPGDTMGLLKAYFKEVHEIEGLAVAINDANTFCLDNEAFRFICAYFSNIEFGQPEIKTYADSWKHSSNEIIRLLNYAARLRPHDTTEILSINETRTWILQLVNPVISVSSVIKTNVCKLDERIRDLESTKHNIDELHKRANLPITSLEIKHLVSPQTVCGSEKCISREKINGNWQTIYSTVCHRDCHVGFGDPSQHPDPALQSCEVFLDKNLCYCTGVCRKCNCSISKHKRIFYEYRYVTKFDQGLQNVIRSQSSAAEMKKKLIRDFEQKLNCYKQELEYSLFAMAKFSIFLGQNVVTQHVDIFEKHLQSLIESEEKMLRLVSQCDDKNYRQLADLLIQYRDIRDNLVRHPSTTSLNEIQDIRQKLFSMPLSGSKIVEIFDIHVEADKQDYVENITRCDKKSIIGQFVDWTKNKVSSFFGN